MAARTLTIVFTDIQDFAARASKVSRADLLRILERHEQLLLPLIVQYGGTVVKTIGDAFLLTFESPTNAVLCGLMMQETLRRANSEVGPEERIEIRVAINTGEVERVGSDVFGETVNIASRVEGITDAGEVYFSEATYLAMHKAEVPTSEVGEFRFKGIPEPVRVYKVRFDEDLELYRKVLASQRPPTDIAIPEGVFSKGLLYTLEQEKVIGEAGRAQRSGLWIFLAVLLLVAGVAGFFGLRALSYRMDRNRAESLLSDGQAQPALALLTDLHERDPTDPKLRELIGQAVAEDVARLRKEKRYDETLRTLDEYSKRFPHLAGTEELVRATRLERAEYQYGRDARYPDAAFEELLESYPADGEIRYRYARRLTEGDASNPRAALRLVLDLVDEDPAAWCDDEWIIEQVGHWLGSYHDERLQKAVANQFYGALKPMLVAHLYDDRREHRTLRRNAFAIIARAGEREAVDELRFYTVELMTLEESNPQLADETFAYFEALLAEDRQEEVRAKVPPRIEAAPVLRLSDGRLSERAMPIVAALFAEALKPLLLEKVVSVEERKPRINAYRILKARSWLPEPLELRYHLANLSDHDQGEVRAHVVASVAYFETLADCSVGSEAIPLLEAIAADMDETIDRWTRHGNAHQTGKFQRLRDATARALGNLRC